MTPRLQVKEAELRHCGHGDLGKLKGRGWVIDIPMNVAAGELEVTLHLCADPTDGNGDFVGFTREEAEKVARALGLKPVVKRR